MSTGRSVKALARRARKPSEPLQNPAAAKPLPAARGTGRPTAGTAAASGSGLVSPLTQTATGATVLTRISSDGFFVFQYPQSVTYTDAVGTEVEFIRA